MKRDARSNEEIAQAVYHGIRDAVTEALGGGTDSFLFHLQIGIELEVRKGISDGIVRATELILDALSKRGANDV
jgi:hypothetical protein